MKEKSTTKQQPYVSTWSLSRICKALVGLGICKIALFVALGLGYSLPDFGLFSAISADKPEQVEAQNTAPQADLLAQSTAPKAGEQKNDANKVDAQNRPQQTAQQSSTPVAQTAPATGFASPKKASDPQGSAAVRAALAHKGSPALNDSIAGVVNTAPQNTATENIGPAPINTAEVYNAPKAKMPEAEDLSWWSGIFDMKSLPIPRLGVDQVAYAATLDAPPPPPPAPSNPSSAFTPPAQTNAVKPAGTAGPKVGGIPEYNPLVPNANPPAPNVNAYVPPEDATQKEQELARREQEILALKQQMEQRLTELQNAERKVQDMLKEAKNVENSKMQSLTNMYVNMKPRQAGAALERLDENIAARILLSMKSKQAGEIMSYMDPTKTAKLTEILTRMRLGQ